MALYVCASRAGRIDPILISTLWTRLGVTDASLESWRTDNGLDLEIMWFTSGGETGIKPMHDLLVGDHSFSARLARARHLEATALLEEDGVGARDAVGLLCSGDTRILTPSGRQRMRAERSFPFLHFDASTFGGRILTKLKDRGPWTAQPL
jgi:hypothetical protein